MIDLSAYKFSHLQDGIINLYRGRADHADPILLAVSPDNDAALETIRQLQNAYSLRDRLDPRWATQPLALVRYRGRIALAMRDPGGEPLSRLLGRPLDVLQFLRVSIAMAAACRKMHETGLIHRDIGPTNVLADDETGGVWLTGFGITCVQPRDRESSSLTEEVAGTLAYMAPEQTGRMNRSVDFPSDLYSLGVTFYEMLTGVLPFAPDDPMELVHCHIARQPVPPHQRIATTPESVSRVVMKLLAKNVEQRYQSAAGLEVDLRWCIAEWQASGRINSFPLGAHDSSIPPLCPRKLYGRDLELASLIKALGRAMFDGRPHVVHVSGYSGVGKSTLVNQLRQKRELRSALFATGKCDEFKRDIPLGALAHVFQGLVRTVLGCNEVELRHWRMALAEALGPNASLIVSLIPELELVIGPSPPLQDLPPQDAQNRFQMVFRRFLAVFARYDRPLVLFLDDLQWLDVASLDLIHHVVSHDEVRHLTLVGAYRDNEVTPEHPLRAVLKAIRESNGQIHEIVLAPLRSDDIEDLLADSLHCSAERLGPLTQLIYARTGGNPFFTIQFVTELIEEKLLVFDPASVSWSWDVARIRERAYTDNIVDLMIGKLSRLPADIQAFLVQLACLGTSADLAALSLVRGCSIAEIRASFTQLVRIGFVSKRDNGYGFLHDRIREAAYALLPECERSSAHLRIGQALVGGREPSELGEQIFEITNQFNRALSAIDAEEERERVAELNLNAARRAKAATAYSAALGYLDTGTALLGERCWERLYRLTFDLELNRAECEFLTGRFDAAQGRLAALRERAASLPDKAAVARLRLALHVTLDEMDLAVAVGLDFLGHVGDRWSPHPTRTEFNREHERLRQRLHSQPVDSILALPTMSNPNIRATMDVLADLIPPSIFTDPNLADLVILRMSNLSLEHGNCDASCFGYAALHLVLGSRLGDHELGYQFAQLACTLVERPDLSAFRARVHLCFGGYVIPWTRPLVTGHAFIRRAFNEANATGDMTFASYSNMNLISLLLASGTRLDDVQQEAERGLAYATSAGFGLVVDCLLGQLMLITNLRGQLTNPVVVDGAAKPGIVRTALGGSAPRQGGVLYWIRKLQLSFLMRDYATADEAAAKAGTVIWSTARQFEHAEYHFYGALARAAVCNSLPLEQRQPHLQALFSHRTRIEDWAKQCPENFADRAALIAAEIARLENRDLEAGRLYEDAIRLARNQEFTQNEAIANELASQFYAARGFDTIAHAYLINARKCYLHWGANDKVRQLDQSDPLLESQALRTESSTRVPIGHLDLATVVKMSQAVSGEIDLNKLINTLMVIAVQHAGAERGLLILPEGDGFMIEAEAMTVGDRVKVLSRRADVTSADLPQSILHYVIRSRDTLLLDNADEQNPVSRDEYFRQNHCRSILCLPLIKQSQLIGVLYLENNQACRVFTPARVGVLSLLASQAAISLEIARVYTELRAENQERRRAEEALRASEASLALGQQISRTCTWRWTVRTGAAQASIEWFRIYGLDPSIVQPSYETFIARVHPDDRPTVSSALAQATRDRSKFNLEFRIVLPDGSIKYLQTRGHPDINGSGELEFVGTDMDITELWEAEEKLRRAQEDLARVSRLTAMGELAGSIVHEINQPLAAVVTNAEACLRWLNRDHPDLIEAMTAVSNVAREGRRAADVVSGLKALARKSGPELANVDVHDAIREVLALIRGELERGSIAHQLDLYDGDATVLGDRVQVQQVLINLIRNGIEAMSGITDRPKLLTISSAPDRAQRLIITIEDSGIGLDPATCERVFDSLFTTKPNGMGMGLAICRSIVEAHRGRLWARPRLPHGTILSFTLPLVVA
jgi:predicted ATPase/signal transduction histidine kinase